MSETILEEDYEVSGLVGSGSVGLVYRATNRKTGKQVAIKEFKKDGGAFRNFLQELSFLFTLDHPNLVKCENLIYGDAGKSFLIMEYAQGGSLRDFLNQRGPLSRDVALAAVRQVLEGLAELHSSGVVHCDIKPENILLFPLKDEYDKLDLLSYRLKLTDLGIGLHLSSSEQRKRAGSPVYMAPEQFYDQVSPASDLYSVGVLLYELCTGRFLFEGDPTQLFTQHLQEQPDLNSLGDPALQEFCELLLKKDPFSRPTDAGQALQALNTILGGEVDLTEEEPTEWFALEHIPKKGSQIELQLPFPGALNCYALPCGHFLISHSNGTDLLDPSRHRLIPNLLQEPVLAASEPKRDGSVFLATPSWVGQLDSALRWKPMFRPLTKIQALAFQPLGNRLIYADEKSVTSCNMFGDLDLHIPLRNYFLAPTIAVTAQGYLASSGPTSPRFVGVEKTGDLDTREVEMPGPILSCTTRDQTLYAVVFPGESSQQASLLSVDLSTAKQQVQPLPPGVLSARYQSNILLLMFSDKLMISNVDGSLQVTHDLGEYVQDACWNFGSNRLLVICRGPRSTNIMLRKPSAIEERRLSA